LYVTPFLALPPKGKWIMSSVELLPSSAALDDLLISETTRPDVEPLVIHAGHYALVQNHDGMAADCLDKVRFPGVDLGFAEFSRCTWESACRAMAAKHVKANAKLMVLVNDWQFLTSGAGSRRVSERSAAQRREEYYRGTSTLPPFHLQQLKRHNLSDDVILRNSEKRWLFSESSLRNELSSVIREIVADEKRASEVGIRKFFTENGEPVIDACDEEHGKFCLLYCGNTNCAGEVVSLLAALHQRGVRRFLNIYPSQCREPVGAGTRLAGRLFNLEDLRIINIAVSGATESGGALHTVVERFGPES
jgi:hypothetical protein